MSLVQFKSTMTPSDNTIRQDRQAKSISIGKVKPLIKLLATDGLSPHQLLDGTGIALSELALMNSRIHEHQYFKLIENACKLSSDPCFALRLGEQLYVNHDGILACRVMSCQNASQAMRLLSDYQSLLTQLFHLDFKQENDFAIFTAKPSANVEKCLPYFIEYTFASIYSIGKFCTGSKAFPLRYEFSYSNSGRQEKYHDFFGSAIQFNCDYNRVLIPNDILNLPFIFENKQTASTNDKICKDKLRIVSQNTSIIEQVKRIILNNQFTDISLIYVSEQLCMSPRTLRRQLSAESISYKNLLENERKRVVTQALQRNIPIKNIAEQVGYQDASSFSRAFKKWFGQPPHLYKANDHTLE